MRMREPYCAAENGHQTGTPTHPRIFLKSPAQARYTVPTIISYLTMCGVSNHRTYDADAGETAGVYVALIIKLC